MKENLYKIWNHIKYWRENYIFLPILIILSLISIYFVHALIGRPILESPEFIIGTFYNGVKVLIVAMCTGMLQNALFGYRSSKAGAKLIDDVYDGLVTIFLLIFTSYLIWN